MVDEKMFLSDRQGRQFRDVVQHQKPLVKAVLETVNDAAARQRMTAITIHLGLPAVSAIILELEHRHEVSSFFLKTPKTKTLRFRQFVGVAVRMTMQEMGFRTTGQKKYVGALSKWFTRAELFAPPSGHSEGEIWRSAQGVGKRLPRKAA